MLLIRHRGSCALIDNTEAYPCPFQSFTLVRWDHGELMLLIQRAKKEIRFYSAIPKSSDRDQKALNICGS